MNDESALRARVRKAMKTGALPTHRPERIWGGPGCGASCAVCGQAVGREEVEFELQFTSDENGRPGNYHVHTQCFAAWEFERLNGSTNDRSLPPGGNGGIIGGGERNPSQGERG